MLTFTRRKKILLFIVFLILLVGISAIIAGIYLTSKSINTAVENEKSYQPELTKIINTLELEVKPAEKELREYDAAINNFNNALENKSKEDQYADFRSGTLEIQYLYTVTQKNYLYELLNNDIAPFAKKYFPKDYQEILFDYPCQDPECSNEKQPDEIISIADDIDNSDIESYYKDLIVASIITTKYESGGDKYSEAFSYYSVVRQLEASDEISASRSNREIADKLRQFLNQYYQEEYEQFLKNDAEIKKMEEEGLSVLENN